jgi:hypothetical protein
MNAGQLQKKRAATAARCAIMRKMPVPQLALDFLPGVGMVWFSNII